MMKNSVLSLALILTFATSAALAVDDMESVLDGSERVDSQASRQQSFFVDTLRSLLDGKATPEQNLIFRQIEAEQWDKALLQVPAAFGGTAFEKTPNGQALLAYLKFKNGLTTTGLEELFAISEPKKIHFHLLNLWKEAAGEKHPAWTVALLTWNEGWSEIFGSTFEVKTKARQLSRQMGLEELKALVKKSRSDSRERALIEWNLALAFSLNDQADEAAKIMASLLKSKNRPVSEDLLHLTAARLLFQNGFFDAAIKYYNKVGKKSDYWLEAQEEVAWSFIRKGEPQNALAVTQTLINPIFKGQVGPESHFVRALAQLKICDYPGVIQGLQEFPKQFKDRSVSLSLLASEPEKPAVLKVLAELRTRPVKWEELGSDAHTLPRLMTHDQRLRDLVAAQAELEREAKVAEDLYAKSLAQTGLQASFESLRQSILGRARTAKAATLTRVQDLAKNEVAETRKILNKMHIVEAEVLQQTSLSEQLTKIKTAQVEVKVGSTGSQAQDVMRFPAEGDVWFDEISNYQVSVKKACQVKR